MSNELRALRIDNQIAAKDMVDVVKSLYPKYDKTMQSKCERGAEYGIQLRADAMSALISRFAPSRPTEAEPPKRMRIALPAGFHAGWKMKSMHCCGNT